MGEHTGDRRLARLGEPVSCFRVVKQRLTGLIPGGEMNMESRPAFIIERFGHEGGHLVFLTCQLLDGGLEAEGSVGGIKGFGVPQIDLEDRKSTRLNSS